MFIGPFEGGPHQIRPLGPLYKSLASPLCGPVRVAPPPDVVVAPPCSVHGCVLDATQSGASIRLSCANCALSRGCSFHYQCAALRCDETTGHTQPGNTGVMTQPDTPNQHSRCDDTTRHPPARARGVMAQPDTPLTRLHRCPGLSRHHDSIDVVCVCVCVCVCVVCVCVSGRRRGSFRLNQKTCNTGVSCRFNLKWPSNSSNLQVACVWGKRCVLVSFHALSLQRDAVRRSISRRIGSASPPQSGLDVTSGPLYLLKMFKDEQASLQRSDGSRGRGWSLENIALSLTQGKLLEGRGVRGAPPMSSP